MHRRFIVVLRSMLLVAIIVGMPGWPQLVRAANVVPMAGGSVKEASRGTLDQARASYTPEAASAPATAAPLIPMSVSDKNSASSIDLGFPDQSRELNPTANFIGVDLYTNPAFARYSFSSGLTIEPIAAYNLIVDSNVLSPSSYGPSAATIGAEFCNTSGSAMTDVWAYVGDYNADNDATPGEADDRTPGTYPVHNATTDSSFNSTFPHLAIAPTEVDYGDPSRFYALEQESGSSSDAVDASRYIGDLAAGECRTEYWLVSYPRKALIGGSWVDVTGGVKPEDDLWLTYFFWATSNATGANPSYIWNPVTMRNEISASANKIWPNGDNKVPDEYIAAIQDVLGWDTWTPNGSGTLAYPGETVVSQGIWYDLGNVGAGFDNNSDFVPDRNIWVQPIGDSGAYDPGCFRLVRTYGLIIVKLNDGTELLIPFVDRMYFDSIPENNNGAVGLVYYEYVALDGACTAGLTPYQEVASGYDNEKFNADFGAGIPPLQSQQTNMTFDKNGQTSIGLGGTIDYTMTFILPDVDSTFGNTMVVSVGSPSLGMPLTYYETVPDGLWYVAGSASDVLTMTNYTSGTVPATVLWSTDSGATWTETELASDTLSDGPDHLVLIQWRVDQAIASPANGPAVTGQVSFSARVPAATYTPTVVNNTSCLKFGSADCFVEDTHTTLVTGTARIEGTVWRDDATGGGVLGNGILDETDAGINAVTVNLYWDANGDGDHSDAGDFLYTTTTSDASGNYSFTNLPATSGSARYLIEVNDRDSDIPEGYGPSTRTAYTGISLASGGIYGDGAGEPSDFGFAPALSLDKQLSAAGAIYVGDTVNYSIYLTNNLPGDGTPGGAFCSYTIPAKNYIADTSDTPPGASSANGRWQDPANLVNLPDGLYGFTIMNDNSDYVGLSGFNKINLSNLGGSITSVQYRIYVREKAELKATDELEVHTYYNNLVVDTDIYTGGAFFTGGAGSTYIATGDITGARSWTFADFQNNLSEMRLVGDKGGGAGTSGDIEVDAAIFVVTTNQLCSSSSNTILNPVPLTDTFDNTRFSFISSDPAATSVSGNTITWTNVGPIYPGSERAVRVTLRATAQGNNVPNIGTSTDSRFENGLPANTPVTDTVNVDILASSATGQISGFIWDDDNSNGWQGTNGYEAGDSFISDTRVYLYACRDAADNLIADTGNMSSCGSENGSWVIVTSTFTTSGGAYSFTGLRSGFYRVVVDDSTIIGFSSQTGDVNEKTVVCTVCDDQSNAFDEDMDAAAFIGQINGSNSVTNVNFGYVAPDGTASTIGDTLFYDWDGDGVQDAIDEGVRNITVRLYDLSGDLVNTTTTDQSGHYLFSNLSAGLYAVRVDLTDTDFPVSVSQTADPDQNGTCTLCDSVGTGSVNGTNSDLTVNFGYQPAGSGSIGDTVWKDVNGDGSQSSSEPGIAGVTVTLQVDLNGDGTYVDIATAVTDASGKYLFTDLPQGTYRVAVATNSAALPNDAFGNDYLPSIGTLSSGVVYETATLLTSTSIDLTADFGFAPPASIGDTVYYDLNGNGTQDFAEAGIDGVTVTLYTFTDDITANGRYDPGETLGSAVSSTTTVNGAYQFDGLVPGYYVVQVTPPADTTLTGDPNMDGVPCTVGEPLCDHRDGMRLYYGTNYTGADFGYEPLGVIGDTLWIDTDADGLRDPSEQGIVNVTVRLCSDSACGTVVQSTTTDPDGYYFLGSVPDGTYYVVVGAGIPAGLVPTYNDPDDTVVDNVTRVVVAGGTVTAVGDDADPTCTSCRLTVDFGYRYEGPLDLSGTVCLENASVDGVCGGTGSGVGANESAYANVVVYLYVWNDDGDGLVEAIELTQIASMQTEADGDYSFENIPGGTYYVVALGAPQDDIELTTTQAAVGSPTTQVRETIGSDGNTVSAYQVVQVGVTDVENRDFAFEADPLDYGDLPASYSTRLGDTPAGPSHTVPPSPNLYLGSTPPDAETNGSPTVDATGDGADEDGVTLVGVWGNGPYNAVNGTGGAVGINVHGSGYLAGWIDFNRDGDFNDAGEMIVHQAVSPGTANYTFDIPADTFAGPGDPHDLTLYARFRLFDAEPLFPSLAYSGAAGDGEVEDYAFQWRMTVDKDTATPTVTPTGTVIYLVALVNWGDGTLTNLQATDILPDFNGAAAGKGYTVLDVTATGGMTVNFPGFDGDTNTNLLAAGNSLPVGTSRAITITLTLNGAAAATYDNTVSVSSTQTGTFDDDGTVAQDAGTSPGSDLEIDEDVTVGSNGSLIIVKNTLPDDAQDFAYTVSGTGLTPFTLDDDADATLANTQTFNSLAAGETYTVAETAVAGWSVTNISCAGATSSTVTIGAAGGFDAGDTAISVLLAAGETVTCTFENTAILSIVTTKTAADTNILETGQSVTYIVEVENTSPVEVTLDSLTDDIFHDITTIGHDNVTATTCATGGALAPGATYACAFAATISGTFPGTHVNTVTAQASHGTVTASDDDDETVTFEEALPELTVVKSSSAGGSVHAGDTITYTITITNSGSVTQNNIAVSDAQPAGTTYVSASSIATGYLITVPQYYLDRFETAQFNNSNGSTAWGATPWTETGDDGIANAGKIQINTSTAFVADFQAAAPTDVLTLTRPVNLTDAASATLTYSIAENGVNSAADIALVQVWNGTAWATVATYSGDFTSAAGNVNILAYANAGTQIRFVVTGFDGMTQNLTLDDVRIQYTFASTMAKDNNLSGGVSGSLINGSPPTLLFAGDEFDLLPGQSMTVSYRATVNNPVPSGQTQVINTASVTSVEIVTPVQATATDNILTAPVPLTLRKAWTNAILNDAVDVTAAVGGLTIDTLASTANTANETDTDLTPVNVTVGQTITFGETFTTGSAANYIPSLACTGAIDKDLSDGLTVDAADTAIVCTETNTRATATLTLQKTWVGAATGDTATVDLSGTNDDSLTSTADSANETDVDATPTTVYAGETVTIGETLGAGNTASYTGTLACSGAADTDLTGGELTVDPTDTAITCTYTNSAVLDPPSIAKSFSPNPIAMFGTSTLTFVITNPNPGTALSGVAFVDNYPGGLVNMNPVATTNTCGGSLTALSDDDFIELTGGSIPAGGSCTITVLVMAPNAGTHVNTTGNVSSTNGGTGNTATATLIVVGVTIGDFVWNDLDADGIQDAGETGISGATVRLLDTGGTQIATTTTDASGLYSFTVSPGTYRIDFVPPAGYVLSPANQGADDAVDSDANAATGETGNYTLAAGDTNDTIDAGMYRPGTISGQVRYDVDNDADPLDGDSGIAGVTIELRTDPNGDGDPVDGALVTSTTTNGTGNYTFANLPPGTYVIVETNSGGYLSTYDLDGTASNTLDQVGVTLLSGGNSAGNDFLDTLLYSISGEVRYDVDNDGDLGDADGGLVNAGVSLFTDPNGDGNPVDGIQVGATITTPAGGNFSFTGLIPGNYVVIETNPAGYTSTADSSAPNNDRIPVVITNVNSTGNVFLDSLGATTLTLQKTVVNDYGGTAVDTDWTLTATGPITISGTEGQAAITGAAVPTGTYTLSESGGPGGYMPGPWICPGAVDLNPNDGLTLAAGETVICTISNGDQPASIGNYIWNDADGQGDQDELAAGLSGVTVNVYRDDGDGIFEPGLGDTLAGTAATSGAGAYNVAGLSAGAYFVDVLGPAGYTLTTANDPLFVLLAPGQNYTLADFGFQQTNATISDYLWNDANGDGLQAGESGLGAGIRVYVDLNHDDSYAVGEPTDLTDASGFYAITGLPAGTYDVRVANPPAGYLQTYDLDGTGTSNEAGVTVTAGETRTDVDFGYQLISPELTVAKSSTTTSLSAPATVTYRYLVTNTGNVNLTGISLSDDNDNDDMTCPATTLPPAETMTCTATHTFTQAQLDSNGSPTAASGVLANTVTANANELTDPVTDSLDIPITRNPAINIAKAPATQAVISGGTANFTLAVTNTGNVTLTGVIVTDAQCTGLPVYTGGDANSDGRLQFTETWTFLCSTINVMSNFTNTASVSTTQGATDSDTASVTVIVPQADLELTKLVSNAAPYVATDVTFTLNIVNRGPDAANGVTVTDVIPTGFMYISDDGGGAYDPATGLWTVGSLADDETRSLAITVRVNVSGSYVNYAQVASSSLPDPDSTPNNASTTEDDDDSVTISPATGDPSGLDKAIVGSNEASTTNPDVAIGEIVTYRVSVNVPPGVFTSARLVDTMERGLSYMDCVGITPNGLTTDVAGGFASICANPTVDSAGGTTTVDVRRRVTFDFGTLTNGTASDQTLEIRYRTVVLDSAGNVSGTSLDNSAVWRWDAADSLGPASETLVVVEPDLSISKTASTTVVSVGSEITITLTIQHTADSETNAYDAVVIDDLPAEMQYVPGSLECISGAQAADVTCVEAGGTITAQWSNFTLSGGDGRVTFRVMILSLPAGGIVNTANVAWTSLPGVPPSGPGLPAGQQNANVFSTERGYDPGDLIDVYGASSALGLGVPGGGGAGGGSGSDRKGGSSTANLLPATGFAPGRVTDLRNIPEEVYIATDGVTLEIPSLGVTLPIVGVPRKDGAWNVAWLGKQAGWLEGTAFPSWNGNSVLTSHVYLSNGLPGPFVNLNKLKYGDQIIVHAYGQKYIFEVRENAVVEPDDTSVLKHETKSWLTLITCREYDEKTDTYRKRVAVRAVLVSAGGE